jgi:cytidine deaminase
MMGRAMATVDQRLVDAAADLLRARFPGQGGVAAAVYTAEGDLFTSVVFEPAWGGGGLCAETGALLEAVKRERRVTASACVSRLSGDSPIVVLTPCGICQERLFHWGYEVQVAVPMPDDPTAWQARSLGEIQPYHWVRPFLTS